MIVLTYRTSLLLNLQVKIAVRLGVGAWLQMQFLTDEGKWDAIFLHKEIFGTPLDLYSRHFKNKTYPKFTT